MNRRALRPDERLRRGMVLGALLCAPVVACKLDRLLQRPPVLIQLLVTPAEVADSVIAGSAVRAFRLEVTATGDTTAAWSVRRAGNGSWLELSSTSGKAPSIVSASLDPRSLATGVHVDTLIFEPVDEGAAFRVPVRLHVDPCPLVPLQPDTVLSDSLSARSCPAPGAPERYARLYSASARQRDSVSVLVMPAGFAPQLAVVDSPDFRRPPLAETTQCDRLAGAACIRYHAVSRDGALGIQVSSAGNGEKGSYRLVVRRPSFPRGPSGLEQFASDGSTRVPPGGEVGTSSVVLTAAVSDPDTLDALRLEVEIRPVGEGFRSQPTATGTALHPHGDASVRVSGLQAGTEYHWQARTVDETGRASAWVPFGGNSENLPDFRTAAVPTQLSFKQGPRDTQAGQPMSPVQVAVLDGSGNVVTSFSGNITVDIAAGTGAGATLKGGAKTVAAQNGVAVFNDLIIEQAGSGYRLQAVGGGMAATSDAFTIMPGPAVRLAFTVQPSNTPVNQTITPAVEVTLYDAFNNVATTFSGTVSIRIKKDASLLGDAELRGNTTVAVVNGVAKFNDLSIDQPGNGYTLEASNGVVGNVESGTFNITVL